MKKLYYIISALGFLTLLFASGLTYTDAPLFDYLPQMIIGTAMCAGGIYKVYKLEQRERVQTYNKRRRDLRIMESRESIRKSLRVMKHV